MQNKQPYKWNTFRNLIQKALEGTLTEQEKEVFQQSMLEDSEARKCYLDYMAIHNSLYLMPGELAQEIEAGDFDKVCRALLKLSNYEKTAPAVDVPIEELCQINNSRRANKSSFMTLIFSVAAILAFVFSVLVVLLNRAVEVGTVSDELNAVLLHGEQAVQPGMRVTDGNGSYVLQEGLLNLRLDNGVEIVVESPAEFSFISADKVALSHGKIFATVPHKAIGFTVQTRNSTIVDLGTEFGVNASQYGDTELYVVKGKTSIQSSGSAVTNSIEVTKGQAKSVRAGESNISDISYIGDMFVRTFSSDDNFVWKGQKRINLVDIINGGNGFGTAKNGICIDPSTGLAGKYSEMSEVSEAKPWDKENSYISPVESIAAVDCIVVPSREGGNLPISTTGIAISDFPKQLGSLRWPLQTVSESEKYPFVLNGSTYSGQTPAVISIHSNCGITFDLDMIRSEMNSIVLGDFSAIFGVNESRIKDVYDKQRSVELYVLLDGEQVCYENITHTENNAIPVQVSLKNNPRFLTILVCCGEKGNDFDWGVIGDPVISIEKR